MNKIVLEQDEYKFQDEKKEIWITTPKINIDICNEVYLKITKIPADLTLNLKLEANSRLQIDMELDFDNNQNTFNFTSGENSYLEFNLATVFHNENSLVINNQVNVNNSITNIHFRGIEDGGKIKVLAVGKIYPKTKDNKYLEDIRVMTKDNSLVTIMPDLLVESNLVEANHNAVISPVNQDYMFYLRSKGLTYDKALELVKKGFLNSILKK